MAKMRRLWKNYNLSIVCGTLFVFFWCGEAVFQWRQYQDDQREHHQPVETSGYVNQLMKSTLENWQSEFLALFAFVVLTSAFVHRGSHESKDGDERLEAKVDKIARKLDELLKEPRQT